MDLEKYSLKYIFTIKRHKLHSVKNILSNQYIGCKRLLTCGQIWYYWSSDFIYLKIRGLIKKKIPTLVNLLQLYIMKHMEEGFLASLVSHSPFLDC
jgi:hypothetical protein